MSHTNPGHESERDEDDDAEGSRQGWSCQERYEHLIVQEEVRQVIGNQYFGNITIPQDVASPASGTQSSEPDATKRALESLMFDEMDVRYDNIVTALGSTCDWLFDREEYRKWQDMHMVPKHHGFLWIKSKPGAGKSTLMKHAFRQAEKNRQDGEIVISFFFNARGGVLGRSLEGMYRSLLYQIFDKLPRLRSTLSKRRATSALRQGWHLHLLRDVFREVVSSLGSDRLTCYVDALDECPEEGAQDEVSFFEELGELSMTNGIQFYVCYACRHYPRISFQKGEIVILEESPGHGDGIAKYVRRRLKIGDRKLNQRVVEEIERRASGLFLWVVLVIHILNKEWDRGNGHKLLVRLQGVPSRFGEVIDDIVKGGRSSRHLVPLLQWVAFASRPLNREELYFALQCVDGAQVTDARSTSPLSTKDIDKFILDSSKGLIELSKGRLSRVRFIHELVRTYFQYDGRLADLDPALQTNMVGKSHDQLKRCCFTYLSSELCAHMKLPTPLPDAGLREHKELRQRMINTYPFLQYAVENTLYHANEAHACGVDQHEFVNSLVLGPWKKLYNVLARHKKHQFSEYVSTADVFARLGVTKLLEITLESTAEPNIAFASQHRRSFFDFSDRADALDGHLIGTIGPAHQSGSDTGAERGDDQDSCESMTNIMSEPTYDSTLPTSLDDMHSTRDGADYAGSLYSVNFQSTLTSHEKDQLGKDFADCLVSGLRIQRREQIEALLDSKSKMIDLLKTFAFIRSSRALNDGELRATMFVRTSRSRINRFFEHELSISLPIRAFETSPTLDLSHQSTGIGFREKIEHWDRDDECSQTSDRDTCTEEEDDQENETIPLASSLPESLTEFESHKAFLLQSPEYKWLLWQLRVLMTLGHAENTASLVRETLLSAMPDVTRLSSAGDIELQLNLPRHPRHFLKEQFPSATTLPPLGSVITICGSPSTPCATTCHEYIVQTWPLYGEQALMLAERYADETFIEDESVMTEASHSTFHISGTHLEVIEKSEVLVWLAVACRSASSPDSIESCEPKVSGENNGEMIVFSLKCQKSTFDIQQKSNCWRSMFRNPVLALGYPVPLRDNDETGLEMSSQMLATMARAPWATIFDGSPVLKGFSTMALAAKRVGSSIFWHFQVAENGDRVAYQTGNYQAGVSSLEEVFFSGSRHFVGWTAFAELSVGKWRTGNDYSNFDDIWRSSSDAVKPGVRMDPAMSISGGKYLTASVRISVGVKDTPAFLSTNTYEDCMDQARRWNVIFSDTATKVHWLADGASTILHFCKAYLSPGREPRRGSDDILRYVQEAESSYSYGPQWAYEVLVESKLRRICLDISNVEWKGKNTTAYNSPQEDRHETTLEQTLSWNTFQGLAEKYYRYLEQLYDRASTMRRCNDVDLSRLAQRSEVIGFDFVDILEGERWVDPKRIKVGDPAQVWLSLATRLDSINLFGADFGALIQPQAAADEGGKSGCGLASAITEGRDYLVAPMSVLKTVADRWTKHTHNSVQLAEGTYWQNARSSFARCQCERQTPSSRCTSLVHTLHAKPAKAAKDEPPIRRGHPIFDEFGAGAIILGYEQTVLVKLPSRSQHSSLSAIPSDSGYGSLHADQSALSPSSSTSAAHSAGDDNRRRAFFTRWKNRLLDKTR